MFDLDKLQAAAEAATPGNWHWSGNTDTGEPYLATWIPGAGRCQVVSIGYEDRSTTGRVADQVRADAAEFDLGDPEELVRQWAHDAFGQPVREPRLQFMTDLMCVDARALAVYEVAPDATSREDPSVYRADVVGIRHPDAHFIAAANPAVILELVAAHRDVLEQGDELRKMLDSYTREYPQECNKRVAAEAVRDATLARIAQAEALHQSIDGECHTCSDENGPKLWPCPTVRALTEGEPSE